MTITNSIETSTAPIKGWCEDPRVVTHQVTHAVEPGRLVGFCGVRVVYTGDSWSEFTRLGRCNICRTVVVRMEHDGGAKRLGFSPAAPDR